MNHLLDMASRPLGITTKCLSITHGLVSLEHHRFAQDIAVWLAFYASSSRRAEEQCPQRCHTMTDLKYPVTQVACSPLQAPKHVVCSWGMILVIQARGEVICLKEKELTSKLELLYNKSLYLLALNLAQSQKVNQTLLTAGCMPADILHGSYLVVRCTCTCLVFGSCLWSYAQVQL